MRGTATGACPELEFYRDPSTESGLVGRVRSCLCVVRGRRVRTGVSPNRVTWLEASSSRSLTEGADSPNRRAGTLELAPSRLQDKTNDVSSRGRNRRLITVMFTDIVASTRVATGLGDARWRELLSRHHALVRRELKRHGGREVDTAGDGFFATFAAPADGVRCACAVSDGVREFGIRDPRRASFRRDRADAP